jgi:hypothetical protein
MHSIPRPVDSLQIRLIRQPRVGRQPALTIESARSKRVAQRIHIRELHRYL